MMATIQATADKMMGEYLAGRSNVGPTDIANVINKQFNTRLNAKDVWELYNESTDVIEEMVVVKFSTRE